MTGRLVAVANGRLLGEVTRDATGRLGFAYDAAWSEDDTAYPLSLSMPRTAAGHGHERIEPWLWGLLPDNENVLARWARRFQVSARSAFSLLSATGEDCPGAVQFARPLGGSEWRDTDDPHSETADSRLPRALRERAPLPGRRG